MKSAKLRSLLRPILLAVHAEAHSQDRSHYRKRLAQRLSENGFDFRVEVTFLLNSPSHIVADLVIADRHFVFLNTEPQALWPQLLASYARVTKLNSGSLINIMEPAFSDALKTWPMDGSVVTNG